jgi:RNA polymerase sigma-70 factor (ECF subfamily)
MAATEAEFHLLMERVLTGDKEAAAKLLERYGNTVLHAVRSRLHKKLRSKFDSLDFVQDVWASFFANLPAHHAFHDQEMFIAFLTTVARNKVADATRQRLMGQQYNVNREQLLSNLPLGGPDQVPAVQSTPSEVLMGRECWDRLLDGEPIVYQRIMILLREGKKPRDIAAELGINLRTVQRVMAKLLRRLQS